MQRSYLDHAATSPMTDEVFEEYSMALREVGNPASTHSHGQRSSAKLEQARFEIANILGCDTPEVTFTSGGTESINIALKGMFWAARKRDEQKRVILLPAVEHHASIDAAMWLAEHEGAELIWLPVNSAGVVTPDALQQAIAAVGAHRVALISFLWANNEVGSISDVAGLSAVASGHDIPVHVDAVAALGQVEIDFKATGATMLSVSAHKVGGPVGVGALIAARSASIESLFHGGSQQRFRAGTQDVAGAVAFASALKQVTCDAVGRANMRRLRDMLVAGVLDSVAEATLRGSATETEERLPGNAHFTFAGCQGDSLLFLLDAQGISVSVGAACQAGVQEISHVLLAMGLSESEAIGSLRMTLAHSTSEKEVKHFLEALPKAVADAKKAGITSIEAVAGRSTK